MPTRRDLAEYHRKRDFARTAEPKGERRKSGKQLSYLIQKHAARALHYDFRLEWDGKLISWAVPKGPSENPDDKRLAVHVEDHPIEYGGFEGTIPQGEYGGGTVMLWDRGTWEPHGDVDEALKKGKLAFELHGKRLHGGWALVRLRGGGRDGKDNWLLIKERDAAAHDSGHNAVDTELERVASGRSMEEIAAGKKVWHSNKAKNGAGVPKRAAKAKAKVKTAPKTHEDDAAEFAGVRVTHPDRVLFAAQGVSKRDLIEYYLAVADLMLPHVAHRPLALVRCPAGSGGACFFQKHASAGFPDQFGHIRIKEKSATGEYLTIEDERGLVAAVQVGVLELHIWCSQTDTLEQPDRMVFDFDPDEGLDFAHVRDAARNMRDRLQALGLESFPMATGGKGIHVVVPLTPKHSWDQHRNFAEALARVMADDQPERFVANMSKAKRRGKIFVDYLRNQRGATAISPYSTRSRAGAYVATPVSWQQLSRLEDARPATIKDAKRLLKADPWPDYDKVKQALPLDRLAKLKR